MKYRINTNTAGDGSIFQELGTVDENNIFIRTTSWIMNTREADVIKALISLGWTPPNDVNRPDACEHEWRDCPSHWSWCRKCDVIDR